MQMFSTCQTPSSLIAVVIYVFLCLWVQMRTFYLLLHILLIVIFIFITSVFFSVFFLEFFPLL